MGKEVHIINPVEKGSDHIIDPVENGSDHILPTDEKDSDEKLPAFWDKFITPHDEEKVIGPAPAAAAGNTATEILDAVTQQPKLWVTGEITCHVIVMGSGWVGRHNVID